MTAERFEITEVTPTPLLRRDGDALKQTARVTVRNAGPACAGSLRVTAAGSETVTPLSVGAGESVSAVELAEVAVPGEVVFRLLVDKKPVAVKSASWKPPQHWVVHVVQSSHHDVGYTARSMTGGSTP